MIFGCLVVSKQKYADTSDLIYCVRKMASSFRFARRLLHTIEVSRKTVHVYEFKGTDPFINLATEDWIFRTTDFQRSIVLLLWRNQPCVVLGRNQNPWTECNMAEMQQLGVPFVRRKSGGGTVYHDLGNCNFTILTDRASFDKVANSRLVVRALQRINIEATISERNDILVSGKKVSGAAYKLTGTGAYHHGTMLLDTDLQKLRRCIHISVPKDIETKGVASVRSPVLNLREVAPNISYETFAAALTDEFTQSYPTFRHQISSLDDALVSAMPHVEKTCEELQSWEWRFGQTPDFTHSIRDLVLFIHRGLIDKITSQTQPELVQHLDSVRYDSVAITSTIQSSIISNPSLLQLLELLTSQIP